MLDAPRRWTDEVVPGEGLLVVAPSEKMSLPARSRMTVHLFEVTAELLVDARARARPCLHRRGRRSRAPAPRARARGSTVCLRPRWRGPWASRRAAAPSRSPRAADGAASSPGMRRFSQMKRRRFDESFCLDLVRVELESACAMRTDASCTMAFWRLGLVDAAQQLDDVRRDARHLDADGERRPVAVVDAPALRLDVKPPLTLVLGGLTPRGAVVDLHAVRAGDDTTQAQRHDSTEDSHAEAHPFRALGGQVPHGPPLHALLGLRGLDGPRSAGPRLCRARGRTTTRSGDGGSMPSSVRATMLDALGRLVARGLELEHTLHVAEARLLAPRATDLVSERHGAAAEGEVHDERAHRGEHGQASTSRGTSVRV
jgi:hypothetical protein